MTAMPPLRITSKDIDREAIHVDPEFKAVIPPLTAEEYAGLESSLKQHGCLDSLKVWRGVLLEVWRGVLLDGHNRFDICERLHIPYRTEEIELPDRLAAIVWILDNQLQRRNLNTSQRLELLFKREGIFRNQAKENIRAAQNNEAASAF
jgi:hypothetical protein